MKEDKNKNDQKEETLLNEQNENIDAHEILEKYDRESNFRTRLGVWKWVIMFLGVSLTIFHLYTSFGTLKSHFQGAIHVGTALGIIFLLFPAKKGLHRIQKTVPWYDVVLAFTSLFVSYYKIIFYNDLLHAIVRGFTFTEVLVSILGVLLVLEATRRTVGLPIVIVASVMILYGIYGNYIPIKVLSHPGFDIERVATRLWLQESGVFGTPVQISAKYIYLFLFFGVMLVHTNIGKFFNDMAFALTGRFTGGTAKAAVAASAFQGMVSGSSVGNTVASGSFTIPMMKRAGFRPEFAAATEASASTGGQIMPPLMGAAAFIMMEYVGTSFSTIMLAALIPAILYFSGIFIGTHFEAKRAEILGLPKSEVPDFKKLIIRNGYMLLPLFIIVGTILYGMTPQRAALYGIASAFFISLIRKDTRMTFRQILNVLEEGARVALPVIAAVATAGIIAGIVSTTGLGTKFASGIIALSGGILPLALIFTMIACIILGMGLPTTANYVVTATVAAPALINTFGLEMIAVHMFVFYFGIVADITPPVCLAAYAGAGIAKANPFQSGVNAVKLAIAAFIIPYMFIREPMLLLVDPTIVGVTMAVGTALLGMAGVSSALIGFFIRHSYKWERILLLIGGLLMIDPGLLTNLVGLLLMVFVFLVQRNREDDSTKMNPQDLAQAQA
ncbi:TRAP transporter permease [Bacillaceae bacterium W0354]